VLEQLAALGRTPSGDAQQQGGESRDERREPRLLRRPRGKSTRGDHFSSNTERPPDEQDNSGAHCAPSNQTPQPRKVTVSVTISLPTVNEELRSQEAYERVVPLIAAVRDEELQPINLDITSAVATVLGALPEIRELTARMAELPGLDVDKIDQLEDLTLAARHANTQHLTAAAPPDDLAEVLADALTLRDNLKGEVEQGVRRGRINPKSLKGIKGGNGYKNLAKDLGIYCAVLRAAWPKIQGKCGTDLDELEHAERISNRILRVVGLREQGPSLFSDTTANRLRAFTLFMRTYDEVRRAVTYLRWKEDDADDIAPSLYAGRGGRGRTEVQPPEAEAEAPAVGTGSDATPAPTEEGPVTAAAAPGAGTAPSNNDPFIE
jgi:hypothetical protein